MGLPIVTITSEGEKLDPSVEIVELEIRRDLNRIPEAELTLVDGSVAQRQFPLSDSGFFDPGKVISIAVRDSEGDGQDQPLFEGLVLTLAVESAAAATSLRVALKDAAFKLTRQRKCAVFRQQADDQAIRKLIEDASLKAGELAATAPAHDELVQFAATDWDFLVSRADALGLVVDVDQGSISVRPMLPSGAAKARLEHGLEEVDLSLELDAGAQWAALTSAAWDAQTLALTSPVDAKQPGIKVGDLDAASVAEKVGGESCGLVHPVPLLSAELSGWADGRLARSRLALLRGRASVGGRCDLSPLDLVELAGVGNRFNGPAMISGLTHRIDQTGWHTELRFGLSPELFARQPDIADVLAGGLLPPVQTLHVGVVGDFEADPSGECRIKVLLSMLDQQQGAIWARVARPDAGPQRGSVFWPEPGDEVLVGFINGDPRQAVVLGALHGSTNAPPAVAGPPSADNNQRALVSKSGTVIHFDDQKKSVRIETPGQNKIVVDDDAQSITLADQHGNSIILDAKGITLKSATDLTLDASSGKVVIKGTAVDVQ